jgi:hypothetical protein
MHGHLRGLDGFQMGAHVKRVQCERISSKESRWKNDGMRGQTLGVDMFLGLVCCGAKGRWKRVGGVGGGTPDGLAGTRFETHA